VVVAVIAVRVMQMTVDQVVGVIAVGHGFMTATGTMLVVFIMAAATVLRCAAVGVGRCDLDHMLIDMIAMHVV
jgi:hypothetical protein